MAKYLHAFYVTDIPIGQQLVQIDRIMHCVVAAVTDGEEVREQARAWCHVENNIWSSLDFPELAPGCDVLYAVSVN